MCVRDESTDSGAMSIKRSQPLSDSHVRLLCSAARGDTSATSAQLLQFKRAREPQPDSGPRSST